MADPIYRTDFPNLCVTHAIDGLLLVFHRPSGMTHFLDSPVPELLAMLADAPDDAAGLTRRLCGELGIEHDDEALAVIEARLDELVASGIVQVA